MCEHIKKSRIFNVEICDDCEEVVSSTTGLKDMLAEHEVWVEDYNCPICKGPLDGSWCSFCQMRPSHGIPALPRR